MSRAHDLAVQISEDLKVAVTKAVDDCVLLAFFQNPEAKDGEALKQAYLDVANMLREYTQQLDPEKKDG